jgi:hypothetical protein
VVCFALLAADQTNLGTDLWILAINAAKRITEESLPSGITVPDQGNKSAKMDRNEG